MENFTPASQPAASALADLFDPKVASWADLPFDRQHIDEQVVIAALEQFEDDLKMLLEFVDVGDRPAFHLIPADGDLLARWHNEQIHNEMLQEALLRGGPKAVAQLLDDMNELEKKVWSKALRAPTDNIGGPGAQEAGVVV